ncbi:MAG TPA: response regulator [Bacteroidota bacterium]|nr:response regulator [Bacteroidota bacterium]
MNEAMDTTHFNKILVVDDASANLQFLQNLLTAHGYTVYPASDGELALEFVRSTLPDLILLDIRMPGLDGYQVCRRLRADDRTRTIPIIFISILEDEQDKVKGLQEGAVDYITKPFQPEEVLARIRIHLRLRELTEHLEQTVAVRTAELRAANAQLQVELTERKRAEEALRQSETLLNATQRLTKVGGWEYDVISGKSFWTRELYHIHGMSDDAGTDHISESLKCYQPEDRPVIADAFRRACENGEPYDLEMQFTTFKGERLWIRTTAHPILEEGKVVRVIGDVLDITERKRAEEEIRMLNQELERRVVERTVQLEAANKELEAFAYSVSHDLRTPLRGIDGFSQLLLDEYHDLLDEKGMDYVARVRSGAQRMAQLIDDLLSLSRVSRIEMKIQRVDLTKVAKGIVAELHETQPERCVEFVIQKGVEVQGDGRLLRIAMENLFRNAWKFTSHHPTARIEFGEIMLDGKKMYFIRDDGAGFNMQYVNKLFGPFHRLHATTEFAGTGIGLATVHRIIRRHGGEVWAEGAVEKGATFFFSIL